MCDSIETPESMAEPWDPRAAADHSLSAKDRAALYEAGTLVPDNTPRRRMANVLFAAWTKSEPRHNVTLYPESYVASFLDMADAVLDAQRAASPDARCPRCDDTGDVHSIDGEWRGVCDCPTGPALSQRPAQQADTEAAARKLAEVMDYPWEHMPEEGRAAMRAHAAEVIAAAQSQRGGAA